MHRIESPVLMSMVGWEGTVLLGGVKGGAADNHASLAPFDGKGAGTVAGDFHTRTMGRGTAGRHGALRKGESIRRMGV